MWNIDCLTMNVKIKLMWNIDYLTMTFHFSRIVWFSELKKDVFAFGKQINSKCQASNVYLIQMFQNDKS